MICEIFKVGHEADMRRMCSVLSECLKAVQDGVEEFNYDRLILKLKLANSCIPFCKESAEMAVAQMHNKDGSTGEHWTYQDCAEAMRKHGYDHSLADWYYAVNMAYSDYYQQGFTSATYAQLAHSMLSDVDGPSNIAKRWYVASHYDI